MLTSIITEALDNNTCALLELFSLKNRFEWVNEYFKMRIGAVIDKKAEKVWLSVMQRNMLNKLIENKKKFTVICKIINKLDFRQVYDQAIKVNKFPFEKQENEKTTKANKMGNEMVARLRYKKS